MEYNYGDLLVMYRKPYSIYLRGTIESCMRLSSGGALRVVEDLSQNLGAAVKLTWFRV